MELLLWVVFLGGVSTLLLLDLVLLHRNARVPTVKSAAIWSTVWIVLALLFNIAIYFIYSTDFAGMGSASGLSGREAALEYFTGYILEKSLSLDNVFVIAVIFSHFSVPLQYQHRVLFWGVFGALALRGVMIGLGVVLIQQFDWMIYVFGALLVLTALRLLMTSEDSIQPENSLLVKFARKFMPVSSGFRGEKFFIREGGRLVITPLFLVLLVVEATDVVFAVDSIPAILAVTNEPFIIYSSNAFAILGLRSLYFVLGAIIGKFRYLKSSLVIMLGYIGVKMLLSHHYPVPTEASLTIIAAILGIGIIASWLSSPLQSDEEKRLAKTLPHNDD